MHVILVYHCNKPASNVFLSIQFDTNVSQLLRHVIPWSYDPFPSLGDLSSSNFNRLSVCLQRIHILGVLVVYYESRKRELKIRLMNEGRCDETLKARVEESSCLTYTGLYDKTN
jgi:hypothetical protein